MLFASTKRSKMFLLKAKKRNVFRFLKAKSSVPKVVRESMARSLSEKSRPELVWKEFFQSTHHRSTRLKSSKQPQPERQKFTTPELVKRLEYRNKNTFKAAPSRSGFFFTKVPICDIMILQIERILNQVLEV